MNYLKRFHYFLGIALPIAATYFFINSVSTSNEGLLQQLRQVEQGHVKSVEICPTRYNEISQNCSELDESSRLAFVKAIESAKAEPPPSHSKTQNEALIKVAFVQPGGAGDMTNCFLVSERFGTEGLFFDGVDAGIRCSKGAFRYVGGSVRVPNFLKLASPK